MCVGSAAAHVCGGVCRSVCVWSGGVVTSESVLHYKRSVFKSYWE